MTPLRRILAAASLMTCLAAGSVTAGVPSPATSTVPSRLVTCPAGDFTFVVITRHASTSPWAEGPVWVDLCHCPQYRLSHAGVHAYTIDSTGCTVIVTPDFDGVSQFPIAGGGACEGDSVQVYAGGVRLYPPAAVASMDQDANLAVDDADVALVRAKLGTTDLSADFDGDGTVTSADLAAIEAHLGHVAPDSETPARPSSWGRLKVLYH